MCPKFYLAHLLITPEIFIAVNLLICYLSRSKVNKRRGICTLHNLHNLMLWKSNAKELLGLVFPWWAWAWSHTLGLRLSSLSLRFAFNEPEKPGGPGLGMQLLRILRVRNVSANERRAARSLTNHSHRQSSSLQVKEGRKWEDLIAFQHSSSQV